MSNPKPERPVIFSAPMVRAILDGRKIQTRRVVKPQPAGAPIYDHAIGWRFPGGPNCRCPYGQPGDRLWVREAWQHEANGCDDHRCGNPDHVFYRATDPAPDSFARWRPSIYMPRWASRITLEVQRVRVERVQDITEVDARAEGALLGCSNTVDGCAMEYCRCDIQCPVVLTHRDGFHELWDSSNAKRGYAWYANPWVWVVEFRKMEDTT